MKPKCIGIIGGAGPLAGVFLLGRLFSLSRERFGCCKDADFPKVFLLSFPFSEMLCSNMDPVLIRKQLKECLKQLRESGACILAIACNTLHAFLDEKETKNDLVQLPQVLQSVPFSDTPLVLCSSTSARFELHKQYFPCTYPDEQTQQEVDSLIDQILKGSDERVLLEKLKELIRAQPATTIILGCTELSLFWPYLSLEDKTVIDPLELLASKVVEKSFSRRLK